MDLISKFHELSSAGTATALCTIIETKGSTPRKAGSKMIVCRDATTFGSVGGGKLELQVTEDALASIESGAAVLKTYSTGEDNDMHCYGECSVFIDPLPVKNPLIIFGAGHVGHALARLAVNYGFQISMVDHREEIIDQLDIDGIQIIRKEHVAAAKELESDENTFIVVCTPSHAFDEEVCLHCAGKPHAYLGMMGSKNKVALAKPHFKENGLSKKAIEEIDMPIGVPINCETPEEIAVSILARLIDLKNK